MSEFSFFEVKDYSIAFERQSITSATNLLQVSGHHRGMAATALEKQSCGVVPAETN